MNIKIDLDQPEFWRPTIDENPCVSAPIFLFDIIRMFDAFGKPVTLNFRGKEVYRTVPGAIFTVLCIWFVVRFAQFRNGMYSDIQPEWSIESHNTLSRGPELQHFVNMKEQKNISLTLEVIPGQLRAGRQQEVRYDENVETVFNYAEIGSFNFRRDKSAVEFFGGEIEDPFTAGYNYNILRGQQSRLKKNENKQFEIQLDLAHTKLSGA